MKVDKFVPMYVCTYIYLVKYSRCGYCDSILSQYFWASTVVAQNDLIFSTSISFRIIALWSRVRFFHFFKKHWPLKIHLTALLRHSMFYYLCNRISSLFNSNDLTGYEIFRSSLITHNFSLSSLLILLFYVLNLFFFPFFSPFFSILLSLSYLIPLPSFPHYYPFIPFSFSLYSPLTRWK